MIVIVMILKVCQQRLWGLFLEWGAEFGVRAHTLDCIKRQKSSVRQVQSYRMCVTVHVFGLCVPVDLQQSERA